MASDQLSKLRTLVRREADMEGYDSYLVDGEVDDRINRSIRRLYRKLRIHAARMHEYVRKRDTATTTAGQDTVAAPSDLRKLLAVDVVISGDTERAFPMHFHRRNAFEEIDTGWLEDSTIYYQLELDAGNFGGALRFWPTPKGSHTVVIWYIPAVAALSDDADTFEDFGYQDWVILDVAVGLLNKEDRDPSGLMAERDRIEADVIQDAARRDMNPERRPKDVRSLNRRGDRDRWERAYADEL